MTPLTCDFCGVVFLRTNKEANRSVRKGRRSYCSRECSGAAFSRDNPTNLVYFRCAACNKPCVKNHNDIKSGRLDHYCSRLCANSVLNIERSGPAHPNYKPSKVRLRCMGCGAELKGSRTTYCSYACQKTYTYLDFIRQWKAGLVTGTNFAGNLDTRVKRYLREKYHNRCAKCSWSEINPKTGRVPVQADHIDGHWQDCREENMTLLCPNCHSLTPTYGILNRGHGRPGRQKYYLKEVTPVLIEALGA